jgi:HEAT repeat protein
MRSLLTACFPLAIILTLAHSCWAQEEKPPDYKSKSLAEWIEALKDGQNPELRFQARLALGPGGPYAKEAVAAIIESLADKKPPVIDDAARALGHYGQSVVPRLLIALKRPEAPIRAGVASALGYVRPKSDEVVTALSAVLKDPNPEVRAAASWSLYEIGRKAHKAVLALTHALDDKDDSVRRGAAAALLELGRQAKPAIPSLIKALKDSHWEVRDYAAQTLWKLGPDARTAVPALIQALRDPEYIGNRLTIAAALGGIGPAAKEAVPALIEVVQRQNDPWAMAALGQIGPDAKAAVPVLLKLVKNKEDKEAMWAAIAALGGIGPDSKDAVPALIEALEIQEPWGVRGNVAIALGRIGAHAKAALPKLTGIVRDPEAHDLVRKFAAKAVIMIDPQLAAKERMETAYLNVRLVEVPRLKLGPRAALTEENKKEIRQLIAKLADVKQPDFGMSATMTGHAFSPLPEQNHWESGLLTNHEIGTNNALRRLVELGPEALPYLLDALEDRNATKLELPILGTMAFGSLDGNLLNPIERRVLSKAWPQEDEDLDEYEGSYTLKVGDICFVAVGQIVGRPYQAVRYQPSQIIIINSPTERKELRERVRTVWASNDPRKKLFDSLLLDYSSEGIPGQKSLEKWSKGSNFQCQAAMRLLYYFPKETAPMISARLRSFDVRKTADYDAWMKREVKNGVYADHFIQAVSWCKLPAIQEALADIAKRTDDPDIKAAAEVGKVKSSDKP